MTVFDMVATWVCRVWAATILLTVALIAAAAVGGRIYDWRERRRQRGRRRTHIDGQEVLISEDLDDLKAWAKELGWKVKP